MCLIMDIKIRWNSLLPMLERFVKLNNSIKKTMIDLREDYPVLDTDIEKIERLIRILKPVEGAVEALCRRETNLIKADVIILFMLKKVKQEVHDDLAYNPLAQNLLSNLVARIAMRRHELPFSLCECYIVNTHTIGSLYCNIYLTR